MFARMNVARWKLQRAMGWGCVRPDVCGEGTKQRLGGNVQPSPDQNTAKRTATLRAVMECISSIIYIFIAVKETILAA